MRTTDWDSKVLVALLVALLLIPLAINIHSIKADSTDPIFMYGGVTLYAPVNTTYYSNFLILNLTFGWGVGLQCSLNYSVDGQYEGSIPLTFNESASQGFQMFMLETGLVPLPELSAGSHRLTICVEADVSDSDSLRPPGAPFRETAPGSGNYVALWVDSVDFTIAASDGDLSSPNIASLSIENKTYNTTNIPINFTVDKSIVQAAYSLDGQANVTIAGNSTLTGLSLGAHNITVYAWDDSGKVGASQNVNFTVANISAQGGQSEPFPISTIIAVFISFMVGIALTFLFFFKKNTNES